MPWAYETTTKNAVEDYIAYHTDRPKDRFHVYRLHHGKSLIEYFPKKIDQFLLKKIKIEGFDFLPPEFAEAGYIRGNVQYYLDKKLREGKVTDLIISKIQQDSIRKVRRARRYRMVISYRSFKRLKQAITSITTESKREKSGYVDSWFNDVFPSRFRKNDLSGQTRARRLVNYLDEGSIRFLRPNDIDRLLEFVENVLEKKYKTAPRRRKLLNAAKVKIDEVALSEVIETFEVLLKGNTSESQWGEFLQKNLFLVESKYIKIVPELNVVMASARNVDFGLVDSQDYLDLFEIKKPTTRLLARNKDRGNYYWSAEAVKALVQAEKYLYNAERKAPALVEDINRQRGVAVKVVRPRAVVIMGSNSSLGNKEQQEDFRILRMSLKNIEVILYDEMLERLKNQRNKLYVESKAKSDDGTKKD